MTGVPTQPAAATPAAFIISQQSALMMFFAYPWLTPSVWLQDDEVDRIERSSRPGGWRGLNRQEVMDSMYGKMDPSPAGDHPGSRCLHVGVEMIVAARKLCD